MTAREMIRELGGTSCRCGARKHARKTFCWPCYTALPGNLARDLYKRVGEGYEAAYEAAVLVLVEKGRIK